MVMGEAAELAGHVFISYVREDSDEVDRLQQVLEDVGVRVWRDTRDLWPGEDWRAKIQDAITRDALVFVACFSRRSVAREKSYQNEELTLAVEQMRLRPPGRVWLIPVRLDDCAIPAWTSAAAGHWLRFSMQTYSVKAVMRPLNGLSRLCYETLEDIPPPRIGGHHNPNLRRLKGPYSLRNISGACCKTRRSLGGKAAKPLKIEICLFLAE